MKFSITTFTMLSKLFIFYRCNSTAMYTPTHHMISDVICQNEKAKKPWNKTNSKTFHKYIYQS